MYVLSLRWDFRMGFDILFVLTVNTVDSERFPSLTLILLVIITVIFICICYLEV